MSEPESHFDSEQFRQSLKAVAGLISKIADQGKITPQDLQPLLHLTIEPAPSRYEENDIRVV